MLALSVDLIPVREHRLAESASELPARLSNPLPRTATRIGGAFPQFGPDNATKRTTMRTAGDWFLGVRCWVWVLLGMRAARFKNAEMEQQVEHPWNREIRASCNSNGEASGKTQLRLAESVVTTP